MEAGVPLTPACDGGPGWGEREGRVKTLSAWKRVCAATLAILAVPLALWAQIPGEAWRRIAVLGHDTQCLAFSPAYATDQTIFAGTGGLGV